MARAAPVVSQIACVLAPAVAAEIDLVVCRMTNQLADELSLLPYT